MRSGRSALRSGEPGNVQVLTPSSWLLFHSMGDTRKPAGSPYVCPDRTARWRLPSCEPPASGPHGLASCRRN
jgi:hypothetical protein